jgi:hypothetical protein
VSSEGGVAAENPRQARRKATVAFVKETMLSELVEIR